MALHFCAEDWTSRAGEGVERGVGRGPGQISDENGSTHCDEKAIGEQVRLRQLRGNLDCMVSYSVFLEDMERVMERVVNGLQGASSLARGKY